MTPKGIPTLGVIPYDRPWIAVDQSNGTVFVSTTGHPQRYVAVSKNKAKTWGEIEALDCDEATPPDANHSVSCSAYPQIGDGNIAAADGTLAAVYTSSAAPGSTCPCAIFETSTDAGAHWNRHVVESSIPSTSGLYVAADPSHKGRFAVLFMPGNMVSGGFADLPASKNVPQEVQVVGTTDSGKTWSTPVTLGNESAQHITKPALDRLRTNRSARCVVAERVPALQRDLVFGLWDPKRFRCGFAQQRQDLQHAGATQLRTLASAGPQTAGGGRRWLGHRDQAVRLRRMG